MSDQRRFIPIAKPILGDPEIQASQRALLTGWVTQGKEVEAFEKEFATTVGATHACAVSSCTTALHLALRAVGVGPGDEVITVSHSFIATANSIRHCGAIPVFVDIAPGTFNMDASLIADAINERTRAILCVHQLGMPCDLGAILKIAHAKGVPVVEDAACAIGSEILINGNWEKIGKPHGDIACFSFHPRKVLTTGEGGMITTSNPEWDRLFRLLRQQGMGVSDTVRHDASQVVFESYTTLGYNYRMTDLQAAIGREQLKRLPSILNRRSLLAARYDRLLKDIPGLGLPQGPSWARSNWQSYCVRLPSNCSQRTVMQAMLDDGVATRRGVMCAHREPAYETEPWYHRKALCPRGCPQETCVGLHESEDAQDHTIVLPLLHEMSDEDQDWVARVLHEVCGAVLEGRKVL
jgi:perosamine synthetase